MTDPFATGIFATALYLYDTSADAFALDATGGAPPERTKALSDRWKLSPARAIATLTHYEAKRLVAVMQQQWAGHATALLEQMRVVAVGARQLETKL